MLLARFVAALLALHLLLGFCAPASAAPPPPEVSSSIGAREVEVGEPFTIKLEAMADQGAPAPRDPELHPPPGITASGPSISTQTVAQFGTGGSYVKVGLGATWQLVASAPGNYVIPAPSISWAGKRLLASPHAIRVVPATGRPRASPSPLAPGFPGFGFPWPFGGRGRSQADELDEAEVPSVSRLEMDRAPAAEVFLRAIADKTEAVVGEQVTISFYVYYRVDFEMNERHEAPLSDFVRVPLLKNPGTDPPVYAMVGGQRFAVRRLDEMALFPVRAGELHTGSMSARFTGRRVGSRVLRSSEDVVVRVSEPPLAGRPPGYALGDVGRFRLEATVSPRSIEQGGSVAVTLEVTGTGNLPQRLQTPARTGLEWLDPEKRESIEPRDGIVGGLRSFGYVLRVHTPGRVDLGAVTLPYWDPVAGRYEAARAELGAVEVAASPAAISPPGAAPGGAASPDAADSVRPDPFVAMPAARRALGPGPVAAAAPLGPDDRFFLLLAVPPLGVLGASALARQLRRLRARRAARSVSPATLASQALDRARSAEASGDAKDLAASVERALHAAIEGALAFKPRGVLLDELPRELEARGVAREVAERLRETLGACERIRFDPTASAESLRELRERARSLTRELAP